MQNKLFNPFILFSFIGSILIFGVLIEQKFDSINKANSIKDIDSSYINITRKKFIFRHWQRSGIFLSGQYIPDPHFSTTNVYELAPAILEHLNAKKGRFQGVDINKWFNDETAESILALEIDNKIYEYKINISENPETFSNYEFYESIIPFIYKDKIAFITGFNIDISILLVDLPLDKNKSLKIISPKDPEFFKIIEYLRQNEKFQSLKEGLCRQWTPYRNFYGQFEQCPPLSKWQE
ncbi:MAG: hypothetical protein Q8M39_05715 [Sulfuricurvum sp.]|nr:hypothetical protein [Sulfuricurvum sp.]